MQQVNFVLRNVRFSLDDRFSVQDLHAHVGLRRYLWSRQLPYLPYLALYPELKGFHHIFATGSESVLKITIFVGFFFFFLHFEQIAGFQSNTVAKNIW